ncbi:MAG: type II secretion system protein [Candidatus Manganitrophus sp.]|nr:type II secretion system protein [Candidatus Manganitrophus sp.]MDC4223498.1 type II secretion system protein [Candidatus Manganitrophus sp.]WDT70620.1 MAG: type II secretion system protein [Candidatus Manganitrophus sp.]WDT82121.1 MAG: type II secretion system protein [Candidatus Manganitrophus sp.]
MRLTLIRSSLMLERGFTLIEIVVFIVVLGFLSGMLIPFTVSLRGSSQPPLIQQALDLAQADLEQAVAQRRANGFAGVTAGCTTGLMPSPAFTCTRSLCYVPAGNLNDTSNCATVTSYRRVEVTISHSAIGNVTAVTLFTNY